ncbi:hypothetical protein PIB30_077188 [Stylosanthes scabra]|uniref:Aminotransferase-like plant mobile domain-containing protein n=1 Tax=Stylosanthes scabra TaxID=79078 RepID=A0ABU6XSA2_9FABA|nr:hypothetical protein [Stylosanthes scabra]
MYFGLQFRWTPYDVHELQTIVPDWIRSHLEIYTWRSAVPVVCFNMVHMHHVDRVLRQYGGEQPVPRAPVDLTRLMTSTGRGEDRWWPDTLRSWYDGWRGRGSQQAAVGVGRFLSQGRRLDDPRWMFAPPDLPFTTTHPRDDLAMPEEAPARRRRPPQPPANARDRRRRERMGVRVGGEEAREEADLFARYEDEGDDGDQPHISPERSQRGDPDIIGSSSMMSPMHASHPAGSGAPHTSPSAASPGLFFHATLDEGTLDEAASYRAGRDQRLDPSSSAFVPSPLPFQGMGYAVTDFATSPAQYETPPAYYDFLSGPNPTPQQDDTAAREPSPSPRPQRPTRTVRPPRCGTGGHLRQGGDEC